MNNTLERKANNLIFGVAAGMADYFNLDVTIVRLILVALMFLDGSGVVVISYLVAAWMMPKESASATHVDNGPTMSAKEEAAYANAAPSA